MNIDASSNKDREEQIVTLRIRKNIVELVDKERSKFSSPRSSWITQAVVEKLERLGYEIE
ncbi:hypothetical protein [Rickettsia endosymbiont of Ixodes scapularis]|uniref:hypothetical protein n=1 Tax=Rickettsia endosymbiont of Ixodes scapularis TaxID=444612 RepID=UPI00031B7B39|nr:hypothetical protein [Rickettsia endosymbiont of Ixodes scapularis]